MTTKLSARGGIRLPRGFVKKLGLRPGDLLNLEISEGCIILTPRRKGHAKAQIFRDPLTGRPVLTIERVSKRPTFEELRRRVERRGSVDNLPDVAKAVRRERGR